MTWLLAILFTAAPAAAEPVRADPVEARDPLVANTPPVAPATQPAAAIPTVRVGEFAVEGLPGWLARQFRSAIMTELSRQPNVRVLSVGATDPALYEIIGAGRRQGDAIVVDCTILHAPSGETIQQFEVRGPSVNLLQVRDALAKTAAATFAAPIAMPPAPARPVEAAAQPPVMQLPRAGSTFAGSTLEWAVENPQAFDQDLNYWSRRSTAPRRVYRFYPSYYYGYPLYPYPIEVPRYEERSQFGVQLRYRGDNTSIDLRIGS